MSQPLTQKELDQHGFKGLPSPEELSGMSAAKLAILLSRNDLPGKAANILIEHELNMRIAKQQSGATWRAAGLGFLGALLAAVLGAWSTGAFQPQQAQTCISEWPRELRPQVNPIPRPPPFVAPEPASKAVKPPIASDQTVQPLQARPSAGNTKP